MPFAIAFAISALLHAAAITMPAWDLPGSQEPESPAIEAHLAPPPKPAPVPVEKAKPQSRPQPTKKATSVPVVAAASAAESAAPPVMPEEAPAPVAPAPVAAVEPPAPVVEQPAPPPAPPWPRQGRVRFIVTYGDGGFVIGETIHEWRVDNDRYSMRSAFDTRGLAALLGRTRSQVSEGEVTAAGLRPREFRDQREGRALETAVFDWPAARVVFSGGRGEDRLAAGTQDLISLFYQLAWLAPRQAVDIEVATASRVGHWTFDWVGEESLTLAGTPLTTLHLRTSADGDTTEIWLAPAHGGLPVKIRYVGRKGDMYELTADLLELN